MERKPPTSFQTSATIGFEAKHWLTADSRGEPELNHSGDSLALFSNSLGQTAEGNRSHTSSSPA
jgi:hypothetical protein